MAKTAASPHQVPRTEPPRRRQTSNIARRRCVLPAPPLDTKPISWPTEFKRAPSASSRPIRLEPSVAIDVRFFSSLNYDARRAIYDIFLQQAGFRQLISCPSITRTGPAKELFRRYLVSSMCSRAALESTLVCGHYECNQTKGGAEEPEFRLADLVALMRTCKFAYLEVSEYLYRTVVFAFSSFRVMEVFLDRTPASILAKIRAVAFIAHMLPQDAQACQRFIKGEYFQTEEKDGIALFKRFTHLERLEINFFPSLILALSNRLPEVVKPLSQLSHISDIVLRVPNMVFSARGAELPLASRLGQSKGFVLERPSVAMTAAQQCCNAYSYQF